MSDQIARRSKCSLPKGSLRCCCEKSSLRTSLGQLMDGCVIHVSWRKVFEYIDHELGKGGKGKRKKKVFVFHKLSCISKVCNSCTTSYLMACLALVQCNYSGVVSIDLSIEVFHFVLLKLWLDKNASPPFFCSSSTKAGHMGENQQSAISTLESGREREGKFFFGSVHRCRS